MAGSERKAFLLRISPELWNELEAWAGDELRSVNGQIEYVLKKAVQARKRAVQNDETGGKSEPGG